MDGWSYNYKIISTYDVYKYLTTLNNVLINKDTYRHIFINTGNLEIKKNILTK